MPSVSKTIEIKASPKRCYEVITDYENYPEFFKELHEVQVSEKKGNTALVTYEINLIKKIHYTLKMVGKPHKRVEWTFVEGDIMKDNHGFWELEEIKKGVTRATYNIDITFGLFVPSLITKKLIGFNLPAMLQACKEKVESIG